jgi:hypothetical protein
MNTKEFIQTIRKVIREEVQIAVRNELDKFSSELNESRVKKTTDKTSYTKSFTKQDSSNISTNSKKVIRKYTENPMLNEILNETAYDPKIIDYNDYSEWPTMPQNTNKNPQPVYNVSSFNIDGQTVNTTELSKTPGGAAVAAALTRDYSKLMKHIEAKKGK